MLSVAAYAESMRPPSAARAGHSCANGALAGEVLSRVLGVKVRTLSELEQGQEPTEQVRRRITEAERLQKALEEVVRKDAIAGWMLTPSEAFEGSRPIDLIERGEVDRLWAMVYDLALGQPGLRRGASSSAAAPAGPSRADRVHSAHEAPRACHLPGRYYDWSETSQVVCFLTRGQGLVRLVARGTKRPKSKSGVCLTRRPRATWCSPSRARGWARSSSSASR